MRDRIKMWISFIKIFKDYCGRNHDCVVAAVLPYQIWNFSIQLSGLV